MEATAGGSVAGRNVGSFPMPFSKKEWRVVSEHHHSGRDVRNEELERSKLGQSDERTIYEVQQGQEPADVDFCSITIDGGLNNDMLQQRLHNVTRQRDELQQLEIELRAQLIVRSEIMEMQDNYDTQIKEHANAAAKLQDQLHEREQNIHQLERKMEEKDRELHAIKLDNEAAWAKEDLLREQNKELATFRRELDNSEVERSQQLQQMHNLQEHFQDKERQFLELQEQNRVAQENIIYKDGQLREAQAWISRAQEIDALHSTTNHSLQAELRERTEQYNQLWLGCQRQFVEMERLHSHTIQQLQLELADVRERSRAYTDDGRVSQAKLKDVSHFGQNNRNDTSNGNLGVLPNGSAENMLSFVSSGHSSTETDHVAGVPIAQSSLLGMSTYLPPGQAPTINPFVLHQHGSPHSVPSHVSQSHTGHLHSIPQSSSLQHWQNQQVVSEGSQLPSRDHYPTSEGDQNLLRSEAEYNYEISVDGQVPYPDYMNVHLSQGVQPDSDIPSSTNESQAIETLEKGYLDLPQSQQSMPQISSQFHDALRIDPIEQTIESKERTTATLTLEQPSPLDHKSSSETSMHFGGITVTATGAVLSEAYVPVAQPNTPMTETIIEPSLLEEQALLACIVRTIPPGGKIRISSTLPNRLGKMLAPLHWHDYKKKYGKLDDFVASHSELFVIEGDGIQLQEGAKEIIAATAAVAKVAAAAAASSPYTSSLTSVAVTPMAQPYRLRKDQHPNGVCLNDIGGLSSVKILSKSKDSVELSGTEIRHATVGNVANPDRSGISSTQNNVSHNRSSSKNLAGKQQIRNGGTAPISRR